MTGVQTCALPILPVDFPKPPLSGDTWCRSTHRFFIPTLSSPSALPVAFPSHFSRHGIQSPLLQAMAATTPRSHRITSRNFVAAVLRRRIFRRRRRAASPHLPPPRASTRGDPLAPQRVLRRRNSLPMCCIATSATGAACFVGAPPSLSCCNGAPPHRWSRCSEAPPTARVLRWSFDGAASVAMEHHRAVVELQ